MLNRALFSSVKDDWPTPWEFFRNLDLEFDFTLDVCAVPWSAKVCRYCVPPHALRVWGETTFRRLFPNTLIDGLAHSWAGERCYMNPPYGREIGPWSRRPAGKRNVARWSSGFSRHVPIRRGSTSTSTGPQPKSDF